MKSKFTLTDSDTEAGCLDASKRALGVDLFNQHGALWIENLLAREFVAKLHSTYTDRYCSLSQRQLRKRYAVVGENRFMITVAVKPPFNSVALYANPLIMPMIRQLLGDDCVISSFGSVVSLPGAHAQPIHFDYPPLFESEGLCCQLPPHAITLVVPLVDLNDETGSTAIWEGSHRRLGARERLARLSNSDSREGSTMPTPSRGDAYLMDFRLIHAGTPNVSDQPRPILYIVYSRRWFCEHDNFSEQPPIKLSKKQFKKIPKEHRCLFANR